MTGIPSFNRLGARAVLRGLVAAWIGVALAPNVAGAMAFGSQDTQILSASERIEMEQLLAAETSTIVKRQEQLDGQGILRTPTVRFTDDGTKLIVELGSGYVPKINGGEFEDHLMEIANTLIFRMEAIAPIKGVDFVFDGYDIFHYFPEDWRPAPPRRVPRVGANGQPQSTKVLISAGHGLYYHRTYTNAQDAAAIADPEFQKAAMRGMEKGISHVSAEHASRCVRDREPSRYHDKTWAVGQS